LQFAINLALGLTQLARQALEGFLFVYSSFGLKTGDAVGNPFMSG
jgi:hypothetical protein